MCVATIGHFAELPRFPLGLFGPRRAGAAPEAVERRTDGDRVRSAEDALEAEEREALLLSLAIPASDVRQAA